VSTRRSRRGRGRRAEAPEELSWTQRLTGVQRMVAAVGAVLGVLVAATTLVDWISSRGSDEPPATIDARLLEVERKSSAQTWQEYVQETKPKEVPKYPDEVLRQLGYVFDVRVSIAGRRSARLPLRWAMHDATTGRPLRNKAYRQVAATFIPEASRHARTWPVWVPFPPARGRYFVRFVLVGTDGRPEDDKETDVFKYDHEREPAP